MLISDVESHWLFSPNLRYISKTRGLLLSESEEKEVSLGA